MKLETLARLWPLGEVQHVTPLEGGSINGAFRVQAERGMFHLRVCRDARRERAQREHAAIAVAGAAGIATPALVPTREGDTLAGLSVSPGMLAALFECAPGRPVARAALTPAHAAGLGALLADVHGRLPAGVAFQVPTLEPPASVTVTLQRLAVMERAIQALSTPDEVDAWALERPRQRQAHLT